MPASNSLILGAMKTLYLIRHAKSSWKHANLDDFDRPLNERGLADAPFMAAKMKELGMQVDALVSSPAKRALSTAQFFARELAIPSDRLLTKQALYLPTTHQTLEVINGLSSEWNSVALFGHNPGFSDLLDYLSSGSFDMPTCAVAKLYFPLNDWNLVSNGGAELVSYHYPKQFAERQ